MFEYMTLEYWLVFIIRIILEIAIFVMAIYFFLRYKNDIAATTKDIIFISALSIALMQLYVYLNHSVFSINTSIILVIVFFKYYLYLLVGTKLYEEAKLKILNKGRYPFISYVWPILGVIIWGIFVSLIVLKVFHPALSPIARILKEKGVVDIVKYASSRYTFNLSYLFALLVLAIKEETVCRLLLQSALLKFFSEHKFKVIVSVLLTATFWGFGHLFTTIPMWVKFIQVFALGVPLGLLMIKRGLFACIIAHFVLNLSFRFIYLN